MDSDRFDAMSKAAGRGTHRRKVLLGLLGGALLGGAIVAPESPPVRAQPGCRRAGSTCEGNQECCPGLECRVTGPGNSRRCSSPPTRTPTPTPTPTP
jgi:hypothetical protein